MQSNKWYVLKNQSLAKYARSAGYDLAIYEEYPEAVKKEAKKATIKQAITAIEVAFENYHESDLRGITGGVYVVSLSNPLSIEYFCRQSQIIYIGRGNILGRIERHFHNSLFDFMQSLSGANFDFHVAKPRRAGTADYYKHIEYLMLEDFAKNFGGLEGVESKKRYPILNSNAGSRKNYNLRDTWWRTPLKNSGKNAVRWTLKPTMYSGFITMKDKG